MAVAKFGLKRILKLISAVIASLVSLTLVLLIAFGVWIYVAPLSVMRTAQKLFLPSDLNITWQTAKFDSRRISWSHWNMDIVLSELLIEKKDPEVRILLNPIELKFEFHLFDKNKIFSFDTLRAIGKEKWVVTLPPTPENQKAPPQSIYQQIHGYLGYLAIAGEKMSVDVIDVQVAGLHLSILEEGQKKVSPWIIGASILKPYTFEQKNLAEFKVEAMKGSLRLRLQSQMDASQMNQSIPFLKAEVLAQGTSWKVSAPLAMKFEDEVTTITGLANITYEMEKKPILSNPTFNLVLKESGADLDLQTSVKNLPGGLTKLDKVEAKLHIPMENDVAWSEVPTTFKIWSMVDLFFIDKDMRVPMEKACRCKIPESVMATIEGKTWLKELMANGEGKQKILEANAMVDSIKNKLFTADLAAQFSIFRENGRWEYEPRVDSELMVHSYQGLRQYLDAKEVIIPSPLDILEGTIHLKAKNVVSQDEKSFATKIDVVTRLGSDTQKVDVDTEVLLNLDKALKFMNVDVGVLIRRLGLDLPPLDPVFGIPSFSPDKRIIRAQKDLPRASSFKVNVQAHVKTPAPGAIQLHSKYVQPHVPITTDFMITDQQKGSGYIKLEPFTIEYLRRKIYSEKLRITINNDEDANFPIDGQFRIEQGGYKVYIVISGGLAAPDIKLKSEPFLPRSDIISVLLFGRPIDKLVGSDAETVGSVDAAIADRAVGLFGLWAFASTPIQSFSYNAVTKVYTATLALGEGLTASVGTNWEKATNLEVRKRLSRRWVLTASWAPTGDNERTGKLVLQWEKRF
ncbi:MAG: translocation/assembly module TamB [Bdellovibrionales bacterium]|nr:translocation/assembly module TamB [Bdellovibrionales bacterium]